MAAETGAPPAVNFDSSTSVPNSPHPGQRPSQRPDEYPHSGQEKTDAAALAMGPVYGAVPTLYVAIL